VVHEGVKNLNAYIYIYIYIYIYTPNPVVLVFHQSELISLCSFVHVMCMNRFVVCFLLGNSLASEFYRPTFQNTPSVASS